MCFPSGLNCTLQTRSVCLPSRRIIFPLSASRGARPSRHVPRRCASRRATEPRNGQKSCRVRNGGPSDGRSCTCFHSRPRLSLFQIGRRQPAACRRGNIHPLDCRSSGDLDPQRLFPVATFQIRAAPSRLRRRQLFCLRFQDQEPSQASDIFLEPFFSFPVAASHNDSLVPTR